MKVKMSVPLIIGLAVLVVGGLVLLRGGGSSTPVNNNQTALTGGGQGAGAGQAQQQIEDVSSLEPSGEVVDGVREIKVTARQWEFTPNPIVVNQGERVRLRITSTDVPHGFALPDFGINEVLNPGQEVTVEFTADKAGQFGFFCSVQCGIGHSGMRGSLIVK